MGKKSLCEAWNCRFGEDVDIDMGGSWHGLGVKGLWDVILCFIKV